MSLDYLLFIQNTRLAVRWHKKIRVTLNSVDPCWWENEVRQQVLGAIIGSSHVTTRSTRLYSLYALMYMKIGDSGGGKVYLDVDEEFLIQ